MVTQQTSQTLTEALDQNSETIHPSEHHTSILDSVHSIKSSALRFLSGTMVSRVTGMIRDMVLAYSFGTHEAVAALFVAFRLSSICRRLFGEGAMQSAFIPYFESLRKDSHLKAFTFFRDLMFFMSAFLIVFCIVSMIGLKASLAYCNWSPGNTEIINLMIILMPSLIFICLFGLNISLLQCQKRYFTAGYAPSCFNVSITIGALALHKYDPQIVMPYVAIIMVFGCFLQWLASFIPVYSTLAKSLKESIFSRIKMLSQEVKGLARPLALGMLGAGASQINNAVDALFARYSDPEGPAQLWYALRIQQLPLALFGIALSGALLPPLARAIQAGNEKEYRSFLDFALRRVTALLLPCSIAVLALGTPLINLIYGRGDFQMHSIFTTTGCLHGYILGLLPAGFVIVLAPAFYAHNDYSTPARGAFLSLITNCILNAIMVYLFHWKAISVALATSISAWLNVMYLWKHLDKHIGKALSIEGTKEALKVLMISVIAGICTWLWQAYTWSSPSIFHFFTGDGYILPTKIYDQVWAFVSPSACFVSVTLILAWAIKSQDLLSLIKMSIKPSKK